MRGKGSALGFPAISSMHKKRLRLPRIIAGPFLGLIALLVGQIAWGADQISSLKPRIESPFRAEALNFYFVHSGGPLALHFHAKADKGEEEGRVVYRFFDANEKLVQWNYQRIEAGETLRVKHDFGQYASQGIYQVRYAGRRIGVEVEANPEHAFGLAPSRTMVSIAREGQFNLLWFEVPLNAGMVTFQGIGAGGMIRDETGRKVAKFRHGSATEVAMGAFRGKLLNLSVKGGRTGDY